MRKIALIALIFFSISGAAFAQDVTPAATPAAVPVFCGDLAQADCAILTKSQTAMAALDSASVDVQANATVTDLPNMPEPITLAVTGNASYSGLSKIIGDVTPVSVRADPGQAIAHVLSDLNADVNITFTLPPELLQQLGATIPSTLTIQERL